MLTTLILACVIGQSPFALENALTRARVDAHEADRKMGEYQAIYRHQMGIIGDGANDPQPKPAPRVRLTKKQEAELARMRKSKSRHAAAIDAIQQKGRDKMAAKSKVNPR